MRGPHLKALTVMLGVGLAGAALADPIHVPYRAQFAGVDIGTGTLIVEAVGGGYRLTLDSLIPGIGERKDVRAKAHAAGRVGRVSLLPDLYSADFDKAGAKSRVALAFADGAVRMVAVLPPHPAGSGRTRPPASQSRGLIDPLSALAVPAPPRSLVPLSVCGRTQRVFDGITRYDVTLFPSRAERLVVAGEPMSTIVCRAQIRAAAGPRPRLQRWPEVRALGKRAVVWLAAVADGKLLVPARIEADFRLGSLVIETTDPRVFHSPALTADLR